MSRPRPPIQIDKRQGSRHLWRPLQRLGVRTALTTLPIADVTFEGHTALGIVPVGIERKTISEIVGCVQDDRFTAGQLPKLLTTFGDHAWLLIEGDIRPGPSGELQEAFVAKAWDDGERELVIWRNVGWTRIGHGWGELQRFLHTLQIKAGIRIVRTRNTHETVRWIFNTYQWYQKPWSAHKSAYRVREAKPDRALFTPQTVTRKMAAQLPDVYWVRSKAVADHFGSVYRMATATQREWQGIEGIGPGIARKVWRALRGLTNGRDEQQT